MPPLFPDAVAHDRRGLLLQHRPHRRGVRARCSSGCSAQTCGDYRLALLYAGFLVPAGRRRGAVPARAARRTLERRRRSNDDRPIAGTDMNPRTSPHALPVTPPTTRRVGSGAFRYQADVGWGQLPAGWSLVEVAGVATDSAGNVFVFNRGEHPVIVFDREGRFLRSWGEGVFVRPHGITIGPDDAVYCVDDIGPHRPQVHARRPAAADAGHQRPAVGHRRRTVDYRTIRRAAGRSTFRRTWRWRPTASCTSPTATATRASTGLRADGRLLALVGRAGRRAGPVSRAARHRGRSPRARCMWPIARTAGCSCFSPDGRFLGRMDRRGPAVPGGDRSRRNVSSWPSWAIAPACSPATSRRAGKPTGGRVSVFDRARRVAGALGRRR